MSHDKFLNFVKEYIKLCEKHDVMILSEGEELQVSNANDDLWGIREIIDNYEECFNGDGIKFKHSNNKKGF